MNGKEACYGNTPHNLISKSPSGLFPVLNFF